MGSILRSFFKIFKQNPNIRVLDRPFFARVYGKLYFYFYILIHESKGFLKEKSTISLVYLMFVCLDELVSFFLKIYKSIVSSATNKSSRANKLSFPCWLDSHDQFTKQVAHTQGTFRIESNLLSTSQRLCLAEKRNKINKSTKA